MFADFRKKDADGNPVERRPRRKPGDEGYDPFDFDDNDDDTASEEGINHKSTNDL